MKISGELQAEIFKSALVLAGAGVIIFFGKKFVDGLSQKLGSIPDTLGKAATAVGGAIGATGAAALSGIEQAVQNTAENQKAFNAAQLNKITDSIIPPFDPGTGTGW